MLKVSAEEIERLDGLYPGFADMVQGFEQARLPSCSKCGSSDTASVQVGVIGRTINLAMATTKSCLIANGPRLGDYWCNVCEAYFDRSDRGDGPQADSASP